MKWKTVTGYAKPLEVVVGKTTAYLRRNIEQTIDGEGNDAWSYEECQMSLAEYAKYLELMESPEMSIVLERFEMQEKENADALLNQMSIMATQSAQDETLANILLNQMSQMEVN